MPTGYTYGVNDGTMTSAREFLLNYARRFGIGYSITQGDKPMPKKYSKDLVNRSMDSYYTKELKKAEQALKAFSALTEQKLKSQYDSYVYKIREENKHRTEENITRKQRYLDMIEKVNAWDAPSGLEEMKESAITHLKESMDFDCKLYLDEVCSYDEWLKTKRETLVLDINYYTKEKQKEDEAKAELDSMLKAFYQSLDGIE